MEVKGEGGRERNVGAVTSRKIGLSTFIYNLCIAHSSYYRAKVGKYDIEAAPLLL